MKFNVFYHIRGPAGSTLAPDTKNPIEEENLSILMHAIAAAINPGEHTTRDFSLGLKYEGIQIKPVKE